MKYLVVGLGNIGSEYHNTRHNIGFDILDFLAKDLDTQFKMDTLASVAEAKHKGKHLTLIKPTTYMNLSGKAVNYWIQKLKIPLENVLIVVDDLHLDLGVLRLRNKGSDGGHNGLKDIQEKLGHTNYYRLRVGIGKDFFPGQQVNYVLGSWKPAEKDKVEETVYKSVQGIKNFVTIGYKFTTENLNKT